MYGGRSKGFSGRSSGKTAVHGNILLPVLVYDGEKTVPGTGKMHFHGADTDGSDCATDQTERTGLQDLFVGPCAAKKLEASRKSIRSYVDFVLTFEEVAGMFDAKGVDWKNIPEGEPLFRASADGRGFAVSGGVAQAVVHAVKRIDPEREVKVVNAEGLQNCKKMLQMAKAGKYNGYLLEGMACPGGWVAGAGTLQVVKKAAAALEKMKGEASFTESSDSKYQSRLESLEKFDVE